MNNSLQSRANSSSKMGLISAKRVLNARQLALRFINKSWIDVQLWWGELSDSLLPSKEMSTSALSIWVTLHAWAFGASLRPYCIELQSGLFSCAQLHDENTTHICSDPPNKMKSWWQQQKQKFAKFFLWILRFLLALEHNSTHTRTSYTSLGIGFDF